MSSKEYRIKHKDKIKRQMKEWHKKHPDYNRNWKRNNKDKVKEHNRVAKPRMRRWAIENRETIRQYAVNFRKRNRGFLREKGRKYREKYPERVKAMNYAQYHKQKESECFVCGTTKSLDFHHTSYEKREGVTLCREHHCGIHKKINGGV